MDGSAPGDDAVPREEMRAALEQFWEMQRKEVRRVEGRGSGGGRAWRAARPVIGPPVAWQPCAHYPC